ncbi:MAG: hypothetical protein RI560_02205 [Natronomonas sp.]|jgi:hypothetical protein|uniref:hypothetical protein n=1 Tax=Natronomonas sp. TaxID=2184060 RepID=UPI00286FDE02|nr:hypothetical protein [Natronomonas sp.]MDR9380473.1 hypothetical protein [Natronomonas sp.]MDR9430342.1 hypothetical protein [Natronomonas sp.]
MGLENETVGRHEGTERENMFALVEEFDARGLVSEAIETEIEGDLDGERPAVALRRILQCWRAHRRGV